MFAFSDMLVFGGLCLVLAFSFWLTRVKGLGWASPPVTGLLITVILVNLNLLPGPSSSGVYDLLGGPTLSAAIFLLLLQVDRKVIFNASPKMFSAFLIGSIGIFVGALIGGLLPSLESELGEYFPAVSAMYVGTYSGGGVNFNTLAATFDVSRENYVYAVAVGVDNVFTALWLAACALWAGLASRKRGGAAKKHDDVASHSKADVLKPEDLAILGAAAAGAVVLSQWIYELIPIGHPLLWLTAISLLVAQTPLGKFGKRAEPLAIVALYLFITALGGSVSVTSVANAAGLALALSLLVSVMFALHGICLFFAIRVLKVESDIALVASQAAVGGPPTSIALAESLNRPDLRIPGAAVGLLGYALGSYLGVFTHYLIKVIYGV